MEHVTCHRPDRRGTRGARQALRYWLLAICVGCVHPAALRGRRALDEGAYALAASELSAAVRARPDELAYWVDLGRARVGQGDGPGAVEAFSHARTLAPTEPRMGVYLGHGHELMRRYDLAEADYRAALALAPKRAWTHRVLGSRLLRWGRADEAIEPLREALVLDADHAETHNALALALYKSGRVDEAERAFRAGLIRAPKHRGLAQGLAIVLIEAGRYADALQVYAGMTEHWPDYAAPHAACSLLLVQLGRRDEALTELEQALALEPRNPTYRAQLASLRGERAKAR